MCWLLCSDCIKILVVSHTKHPGREEEDLLHHPLQQQKLEYMCSKIMYPSVIIVRDERWGYLAVCVLQVCIPCGYKKIPVDFNQSLSFLSQKDCESEEREDRITIKGWDNTSDKQTCYSFPHTHSMSRRKDMAIIMTWQRYRCKNTSEKGRPRKNGWYWRQIFLYWIEEMLVLSASKIVIKVNHARVKNI